MSNLKKRAGRVARAILGPDSALGRELRQRRRSWARRAREGRDTRMERLIRLRLARWKARDTRRFTGRNFTYMWNGSPEADPRIGIYAKGSCDLPAMFAAAPQVQSTLSGDCAMYHEPGGVAAARSDILLQSLGSIPADTSARLVKELLLPPRYFEPTLFEDSFEIPGFQELGRFPKTAVLLSIGSEVIRVVYRHRESGLLVDPGGWWLNQDMAHVLANLDKVNWFRESFEDIGRLTLDDFYRNYSEVIRTLKERTTANVLVMNMLEVEPGDPTHSYQLVWNPGTERRRAFNLALIEMSRELDFAIVDVDKILKNEGVRHQVDFAHYSNLSFQPLALEINRILAEMGVFHPTVPSGQSPRRRSPAEV